MSSSQSNNNNNNNNSMDEEPFRFENKKHGVIFTDDGNGSLIATSMEGWAVDDLQARVDAASKSPFTESQIMLWRIHCGSEDLQKRLDEKTEECERLKALNAVLQAQLQAQQHQQP
ncbi:hypothetical protein CF319_g4553 [Tilletia indica]|nr:hypothetical protein CF319_g4553 [Tilletia indica]